jgi:hypothetical protein
MVAHYFRQWLTNIEQHIALIFRLLLGLGNISDRL